MFYKSGDRGPSHARLTILLRSWEALREGCVISTPNWVVNQTQATQDYGYSSLRLPTTMAAATTVETMCLRQLLQSHRYHHHLAQKR
ncbi:hypothetical protein NE237_002661 [Protea cynaroides]|uniref:Uncharacterized protein n=1 Tax=Protea cynaroides TaxID=273540 RepID=A0A9Q0GKC0_9MAGN|nr:hypothetical protein NE237_002661 [Protea cynaroides]